MDQNLEQKLKEIVEQVKNVSDKAEDAPLRRDLQKQIADLLSEITKKPVKTKEPSYLSSAKNVPDELYRIVEVNDIVARADYERTDISYIPDHESDYLDLRFIDIHRSSNVRFYRVNEKEKHLSDLKNDIRKQALEIAKKFGFDAVVVEESEFKVDRPIFSNFKSNDSFDLNRYTNVSYTAKALATFYVLKESGEQNAAKP